MDASSPGDFSQASPFSSAGSPISAPPPPPEVKVRTMRSDLESMAKSGGGLPRFQNVAVTGLSIEKNADPRTNRKKSEIMTALVIIFILCLIGGGLYYIYVTYFVNPAASPAVSSSQTSPSPAPAPSAPPQAAPATPAFTHVSLFTKVPDQTLAITFAAPGAVQSATDLQSYGQKVLGILATAKTSASIIELDAQSSDGHDLSINELLSEAGAQVLDPQFISAHFNPDPTFFAYQDKGGFWPGYVVELNLGENWIFLTSGLQEIETSTSIGSLYLTNPGTASAGGFATGTISGTPVRILPFSATGTAFVYGQFGNKLILSTSANGFAAAISRLQ